MSSPAVGKVLEAGLVVLYIGLVTTALVGGAVPGYRTTAGDAVAERTLATVVERIQQAVPPNRTAVRAVRVVDIPDTIAGAAYRIELGPSERSLRLVHPDPAIGGELGLALPHTVATVSGGWESGGESRLVVRSVSGGLAVRLEGA